MWPLALALQGRIVGAALAALLIVAEGVVGLLDHLVAAAARLDEARRSY